jgi:hypothetical protein
MASRVHWQYTYRKELPPAVVALFAGGVADVG